MIDLNNIPAYILCGGKSSRMQTEKGLVLLEDKPIIQHIINTLTHITKTIYLVTANTDYEQFGFLLVADRYKEKGPLGGIHAALSHTKQEAVLILSCDVPRIESLLLKRIIAQHFENTETEITLATGPKKWHPLVGVYSQSILQELEIALNQNHLKVMDFIKRRNYQVVEFDSELPFANINTPQALEKLNTRYS